MWIEDFRRANGLTLEELGAYIRRLGKKKHPPIKVSDTLLERLEEDPKFVTVTAIADLIAEACGATAEQRDELVLERHRGTWKPKPGRKPALKLKAEPTEEEPEQKNDGKCHPVVAVDRAGFAVMRFSGVNNAAASCGTSHHAVYARCLRQQVRDEFRLLGFTFRYAEEWEKMTDAERRADVEGRRTAGDGGGVDAAAAMKAGDGAGGTGRGRHYARKEVPSRAPHAHYQRGVVAVDRQGREVKRWGSVKETYQDTGVAQSTVSKSILGRRNKPYVQGLDLAFVAAEEWDDMTMAQRRERLGLKGGGVDAATEG